jgi:hypothetical protein
VGGAEEANGASDGYDWSVYLATCSHIRHNDVSGQIGAVITSSCPGGAYSNIYGHIYVLVTLYIGQ